MNGNLAGENLVENVVTAAKAYPLYNDYWASKAAVLGNIDIPVCGGASYTNTLHTVGTFRAWDTLRDENKWLRVHNSLEWPDFYII
ncbi:MAG: hypothetical protein LUB61_01805 [Eggerthellaceae bacterium]|nr:hypothetical protein [Eggerthellaceae bacterium]